MRILAGLFFMLFVAGRSGSVIYGQNGLGRAVRFRAPDPHPTTATTFLLLLRAGADPVIACEANRRRFESCPERSRSGSSAVEQSLPVCTTTTAAAAF